MSVRKIIRLYRFGYFVSRIARDANCSTAEIVLVLVDAGLIPMQKIEIVLKSGKR